MPPTVVMLSEVSLVEFQIQYAEERKCRGWTAYRFPEPQVPLPHEYIRYAC